jgi:hypothetical protein
MRPSQTSQTSEAAESRGAPILSVHRFVTTQNAEGEKGDGGRWPASRLRLSRVIRPEKNVVLPLPSVRRRTVSFFPEPKTFGSADGWPAFGRPAGGRARCVGSEEGESQGISTDRRFLTVSQQMASTEPI